ncbi:phage minor structural protein [Striga asiatica]|uniref:Phage minor structural protein n=1 Tax=Striga asiatica TaxID=4170 RepID=A0A5A7PZH2_STRAF|nr:phage minor structural protein [Striga asiatica]
MGLKFWEGDEKLGRDFSPWALTVNGGTSELSALGRRVDDRRQSLTGPNYVQTRTIWGGGGGADRKIWIGAISRGGADDLGTTAEQRIWDKGKEGGGFLEICRAVLGGVYCLEGECDRDFIKEGLLNFRYSRCIFSVGGSILEVGDELLSQLDDLLADPPSSRYWKTLV